MDSVFVNSVFRDSALADCVREAQHDARSTSACGSTSAAQQQRPARTRDTQPDPADAADCSRNTTASTSAVRRRPAWLPAVGCADRRFVTETA
jgi:hypothetical protein